MLSSIITSVLFCFSINHEKVNQNRTANIYFNDRKEAGQKLVEVLKKYKNKEVIIYALPRGGVICAAEIAKALHAPLELIIVKKIGHPYEPEYAIGAMAENDTSLLSEEAQTIDQTWLVREFKKQKQEIERRRQLYVGNKKPLTLTGKIALVVDDGLATGLTMRVAIQELKKRHPQKVVLAVPVAPADTMNLVAQEVDEVVVLKRIEGYFGGVGRFYEYFPQVSDEEVVESLRSVENNKIR